MTHASTAPMQLVRTKPSASFVLISGMVTAVLTSFLVYSLVVAGAAASKRR